MRKSSLIRDILLVSAGLATGVVTTVGTVVGGTALFMLSINGKSIENATKLDLFGPDYEEKSLYKLVMSFVNNEVDYNTLAGLEAFSPEVANLYNALDEFAQKYGVHLNKEEFYNLKFEEYPAYFERTITSSISLAGFLNIDENSEEILKYFFYATDDEGNYDYSHPYTVADFTGEHFVDGLIQNLPLAILYGSDTESIPPLLEYMFYPRLGDTYDYDHPYTYSDFTNGDFMNTMINNLKISYIYGGDTHGIMSAIGDLTIAGLNDPEVIGTLKVSDFFEGELSGMAAAFADFTINDFNDETKIDSLIVGQLLGDAKTSVKTTFDEEDNPLISYVETTLTGTDEQVYTFTMDFVDNENNHSSYIYTKPISEGNEPYQVYLAEDGTYYLVKSSLGGDNAILSTIAKYSVGTLKTNPNIIMSSVHLSDLVGTVTEENNPLLYAVQDLSIAEMSQTNEHGQTLIEERIYGLTLGKVLGVDPDDPEADPLMASFAGLTINELSDANTVKGQIYGLKLSDFLSKDDEGHLIVPNPIIQTFVDNETTIGQLLNNDTISTFTLEDILGSNACNESPILNALRDETLLALRGEAVDDEGHALPNPIDSLTIKDIFGEESCASSTILNAIKDYTLTELGDGHTINSLTIGELLGNYKTGVIGTATKLGTVKERLEDDSGDMYTVTFKLPDSEDTVTYSYVVKGETTSEKPLYVSNNTYYVRMSESSSKIIDSISGYTLDQISDPATLNGLKLSNFIPDDATSPIITAISGLSISDLSDSELLYSQFDSLTVSEIFGEIDDSSFLSLIKDYTVADLKSGNSFENDFVMREILGDKPTHISDEYDFDPADTTKVTNEEDTLDTYTLYFKKGLEEETFTYSIKHEPGETTTAKNVYKDGNGFYWVEFTAQTKLKNLIGDWTLADIKSGTKFNNILVSDLIDVPSGDSPIIDSLSGLTLGNLNESTVRSAMGSVPLKAFLETDEEGHIITDNPIILAIIEDDEGHDVTVNGLEERLENVMDKITIKDIFGSDRTGILKNIPDDTAITDLEGEINDMPVIELFEDDIFDIVDGNKIMKTEWKFLLTPTSVDLSAKNTVYSEDSTIDNYDINSPHYANYKLGSGFGEMLSNFKYHIQHEPLTSLSDAGMIGTSDASFFTREIGQVGYNALSAESKVGKDEHTTYGELTINELFEIMDNYAQIIANNPFLS